MQGNIQRVDLALNLENREIAVENPYFSTLSTGFSTGVIHSGNAAGICILVDITGFDRLRLFCLFFFRQHFAKAAQQVEKNST